MVLISDYTRTVDKQKVTLPEMLKKHNIMYILNNDFGQSAESQWFDIGNPLTIKCNDPDYNKEKYFKCSLVCNDLIDSRLYLCAPSCFASIGNVRDNINEVSLDFNQIIEFDFEKKSNIIGKYLLGFMEREFSNFCMYCNGYGKDVNCNFVIAGEQIER